MKTGEARTEWLHHLQFGSHFTRQHAFLQEDEDLLNDDLDDAFDPETLYQDLYEIPFSAVRDYLKYIHEQELFSS